MPLYDYECRSCEKVTEVRHGFKETFDGVCPACGGAMKRVFHAAGIVFKGSGFYLTDSRKAESASANGSSSSAKSDGAKGDTPKSESSSGDGAKSESKSETKSDSSTPAAAPAASSPKSETAA